MSNLKKIIVSLPDFMLEQTDRITEEKNINRSELIREALTLYIEEQKKMRIRAELIRGYKEMSGLNLSLAEEGMGEALTVLREYEVHLK